MSKKSFRTSFDDLLGGTNIKKEQISATNIKPEVRATFLVKGEHLDKVKAISFYQRKMIKEVLADALELYIENYEKTNGAIQLPKI